MGSIIVSYKIFPTDITVNFDELKAKIEKSLPKSTSIYGYAEEPIAFGLNALIAHIKLPEDETGILDTLEKNLEGIKEVSQIQTLTVRRTSR